MTGEMCREEVTRDAYPLHYAFADKYKGTVEPFDQYQGPFVLIPGRGRFWLTTDDGHFAWWYDEGRHKASSLFSACDDNLIQVVEAADELMTGGGFDLNELGERLDPNKLVPVHLTGEQWQWLYDHLNAISEILNPEEATTAGEIADTIHDQVINDE